ncbi:hypothetical protein BN946_scf184935.g20 [Trametes cinnabarina]|uniref:N-acetyltransferase domain-containing protein n=1 Tax=Pycnoporus cinnabarinus TaxID=5643 RepID=A0A060STC9_PYCCI|nr:hypothetical protein BN946_scf184935.g20 [Trametes cinnabarina]
MPLSQFYPVQHDPCTGEPYIRLPVPFERFTITPPRREDVPHIIRILNDDPVKRWIDGLPFPYLEEHAEEWVAATLEKSDAVLHELRIAEEEQPDGPPVAVSGCPVNCLRRTEEDGSQWFAGVVEFNRSYFPDVRDRTVQDRLISRNESRKAGDEEIVWCVGCEYRSHSTDKTHLADRNIHIASLKLAICHLKTI